MPSKYDLVAGLQYESSKQEAPTVVLKGERDIADRVVYLARRYGIPVVEDPNLSEAIQGVPLDTEIPESLYRAVAVVLNHIESFLVRPVRKIQQSLPNGR
jgi:flagellar biosynthesis protein